MVRPVLLGSALLVIAPMALAGVVQQDDLVFGLSDSDGAASLELVRGGVQQPDSWNQPFIQSVEFDNFNGISHNAAGNVLGVNFGTSSSGGSIYALATDGSWASNLIGNTTGMGGGGITQTRLGGLSVAPDNSKIAVTGFDTGRVIVYDYLAGPGDGTGTLSNARESDAILFGNDTQGTTWLNANTILAFSTTGDIYSVDATNMTSSVVATVQTLGGGPGFTDIEYNPDVSPFVYAMYSAFTGSTTNLLFVLDPDNGFALVDDGVWDFSTSMDTAREIAFDSQGNLYVSQFGSAVDVIVGAADPTTLADNTSVDYYTSGTFSSFNGLDVAKTIPEPGTLSVLAALGVAGLLRRRG